MAGDVGQISILFIRVRSAKPLPVWDIIDSDVACAKGPLLDRGEKRACRQFFTRKGNPTPTERGSLGRIGRHMSDVGQLPGGGGWISCAYLLQTPIGE